MTNESMTISLLGVDERSKSAYEFFFNSIKRIQCELINDYSKAELCLIDKDSYNAQQQYETLRKKHPEKYILVISLEEHSCSDNKEFFLKKPVKRDALQEALKQICRLKSGITISISDNTTCEENSNNTTSLAEEQLSPIVDKDLTLTSSNVSEIPAEELQDSNRVVPIKKTRKVSAANAGKLLKVEHEEHFVGDQDNIDIRDPQQLKKAFYTPNKLLQSVVEQACIKSQQSGKIVQLNVLNHVFYFDSKEQKVYSTFGPGIIRPLCLILHDNNVSYSSKDNSFRDNLHEIIQNNKNKITKKTLEKQSWNMESFMWLITLWSSRGRVPLGTDLTQPVYLMQWPNLTRLATIPHAVRIAALLYKQPHLLTDAAKQLGIEQRYVFAFYSACKSIGLANISRRKVDKLFVPEKPKPNKHQSILRKLLGKLIKFTDKSSMNEIA